MSSEKVKSVLNHARSVRSRPHGLLAIVMAIFLIGAAPSAGHAAPAAPSTRATTSDAPPQRVPAHPVGPSVNEFLQLSGSRSVDWTGDDWPDLLVRNGGTGDLLVYPSNGQGGFNAAVLIGIGWQGFDWIGAGEFTGDDWPDIITRRASDGALFVYPSAGPLNGTSTLLSPVLIGLGWGGMKKMLIADVSGDGNDDIVALSTNPNAGSGTIYVYPHSGVFNGTNTLASPVVAANVTATDSWLLLPQWDIDLQPSLIQHSFGNGGLYLKRANGGLQGTQTWSSSVTTVSNRVFDYNQANLLSLCDVNGDGYDDVVYRTPGGDLWYYPSNDRIDGLNTLASSPVYIGNGWQIMDIIS